MIADQPQHPLQGLRDRGGELLVAGGMNDQAYRLDDHDGGALWSRASLVVPREVLDPAAILGDADTVVVAEPVGDPS